MKQRPLFVGFAAFSAFIVACLAMTWATEPDSNPPATKPTSSADAAHKQPAKLNEAQTDLVNQIFSSRLLEIAAEYKQYERVDQTIRWSPTLCDAPPRQPKNLAAFSASDSRETHGKKLYFLYARKPWDYRGNVWGLSRGAGDNEKKAILAPLGQVLVKEAWNPVKLDHVKQRALDKKKNSSNPGASENPEQLRAFATDGEFTYHAGDKKGLFIMFKTWEGTPGTDRGWVYGTVSADGKKITSVGLVKNCMQCHQDAHYDRQIGLQNGQHCGKAM